MLHQSTKSCDISFVWDTPAPELHNKRDQTFLRDGLTQHDFKGCIIMHSDLRQRMIKFFLFEAYDKSLLLEAYKPH